MDINNGDDVMALKKRIDKELAGDEGWWKRDTGDTYLSLAEQLIARGFTEDEAIELLGEALSAVREEYGD